jgi:hypothetical protein
LARLTTSSLTVACFETVAAETVQLTMNALLGGLDDHGR